MISVSTTDLTTAWRVLHAVAQNYKFASRGQRELIEAARLIEVECREQHGHEAWAAMTDREVGT